MSDYIREIPRMDLGLRRLSKQANKEGREGGKRGREGKGRKEKGNRKGKKRKGKEKEIYSLMRK